MLRQPALDRRDDVTIARVRRDMACSVAEFVQPPGALSFARGDGDRGAELTLLDPRPIITTKRRAKS